MRSEFSRRSFFHRITLRMVSVKFSHTQQVQFAAVRPPLRMSSKTARLKSEMMRPSITIDFACRSADIQCSLCGLAERADHYLIIVEHEMNFVKMIGETVTVLHQQRRVLVEADVDTVMCDRFVRDVY